MTRTMIFVGGILAAGLLAFGTCSAEGAILATDANGMSGWQGTTTFDTVQFFGTTWYTVDIDYCVYEPGDFNSTFGIEPQAGHYVYAYQMVDVTSTFNGYVNDFTVGLNGGDEQAGDIGFVAASGDVDPSNEHISPSSAVWEFSSPNVGTAHTSAILYYSSPFGPELDTASVSGYMGTGDTRLMPSPVPEPATVAMLAAGIGWICAKRRRKQ